MATSQLALAGSLAAAPQGTAALRSASSYAPSTLSLGAAPSAARATQRARPQRLAARSMAKELYFNKDGTTMKKLQVSLPCHGPLSHPSLFDGAPHLCRSVLLHAHGLDPVKGSCSLSPLDLGLYTPAPQKHKGRFFGTGFRAPSPSPVRTRRTLKLLLDLCSLGLAWVLTSGIRSKEQRTVPAMHGMGVGLARRSPP